MSNNDYILDAVKGEPGSLTSIAFHTGAIAERARIIKLLQEHKATRSPMVTLPYAIEQAIALIQGETK